MKYNPRLTKPAAGNPFYNTTSNGGYSTCIVGQPTDPGCNVLANCVGYACGRFNEIIGAMKYPLFHVNAYSFIWVAKTYYPELQITDYPTLGGIMVFKKKGAEYGHVLIPEVLESADTIITSESAWHGSAFFTARRYKSRGWVEGYDFLGNIVNPAIGDIHWVDGHKYKLGDKVIINGPLYVSSTAETPSGYATNITTKITRVVDAAHPYNTTGDLGWMNESDIQPYTEPTLKIGDKVEIISTGKASKDGDNPTAYGIGWTCTIGKIYEGAAYPYRVDDKDGAVGFYKAEALRKL